MKIVINTCYGGFGLSDEAIKELYKRGSKIIKVHEPKDYYGGREGWEKDFERDKKKDGIFHLIIVNDKILTTEDYEYELRADKDLVEVVEVLGSEKASGKYANLKVVKIPDNIKWTIQEYDGVEWVAEKHRIWR